jgi:hypothetical protein
MLQRMKRRLLTAIEIEAVIVGALVIWALATGLCGIVAT